MKILLLAPELLTTDSGIPRILRLYLKALCELAAERGDRVSFLALNDAVVDSTDLRNCSGPALADWSICSGSKLRFLTETLRLSRDVDLIICGHVAQLPVVWIAQKIRPRLRSILVAHGIEVWRPFSFLEKLALRAAQKIFCVSAYTRAEILKQVSLEHARLVVLPNALDPKLEPNPNRTVASSSQPVILTVARLASSDRYKGIDRLIEAMPAIVAEEPTARLRVVGRGDDQTRLYELARSLRIATSVEFAGFVSDEKLHDEFDRCRLFALPSEKEGFGLVYVEAMAHGRPCLGANAGGAPEVITPETGVLVTPNDVPELARAVVSALRQPWNEASLRARAAYFSYSQFRARLASLIYE
jgi:glycosyltransferase involved in cell wall biosynthesis